MNIDDYVKDNTLTIWVKANSDKNKIMKYDKIRQAVKVDIKEPAQDNKANIEIIKYFSKLTGKKVKILRGLKSKKKVLKFID